MKPTKQRSSSWRRRSWKLGLAAAAAFAAIASTPGAHAQVIYGNYAAFQPVNYPAYPTYPAYPMYSTYPSYPTFGPYVNYGAAPGPAITYGGTPGYSTNTGYSNLGAGALAYLAAATAAGANGYGIAGYGTYGSGAYGYGAGPVLNSYTAPAYGAGGTQVSFGGQISGTSPAVGSVQALPTGDTGAEAAVQGSGTVSSLGSITWQSTHLMDLNAQAIGNGSFAMSTSAGVLYGEYTGGYSSGTAGSEFELDFTVTGGTGYLSGATGSGVITGQAVGTGFTGTISGAINPPSAGWGVGVNAGAMTNSR